MGEGVPRCSHGSGRIVTGFEAHLLWRILINFGFLSFCGIKVLLLLRLAPVFVSKGLGSQRSGLVLLVFCLNLWLMELPGVRTGSVGGGSLKLDEEGYASELREIIS